MKTFVIKITEIVGKEEVSRTVVWDAETSEQVDDEIRKSYNKRDWEKVVGYSIFSLNSIPEIVFYAVR